MNTIGTKSIAVLFAILSVCILVPADKLCAQQTNLQVFSPTSVNFSRSKTRDISFGYLSMRGKNVDADGLDIAAVFGERTSSSTYRSVGFGAALVGAPGSGDLYLGSAKKDMVGMVLHVNGDKRYFGSSGENRVWSFLTSIPFSAGNFTIGNSRKEEITVYSFITGVQGGADLNIKTGNFVTTPSLVLSVLGGYREIYKGGVYWDNLNSGGISPFVVMTLGVNLAYLPKAAKLSGIYQRTFSSGSNKAINSLVIRLTIGRYKV